MSKVPTVWILGAGFSRSLGGPLLDDLLSMRSWARFCAQDPGWELDHDLNQTYALYHYGRGFPEGYLFEPDEFSLVGQLCWRNAEEFLEFLNSGSKFDLERRENLLEKMQASFGPQLQRTRVGRFPGVQRGKVSIDEMSKAALRILSMECDIVPIGEPDEHLKWERARPYIAWGSSLNRNDHILSFNYDLVVEELANPNTLIFGVDDKRVSPSASAHNSSEAPTLYKMHGSLDWVSREDGYHRVSLKEASPPAIATPGNAKLEMKEGGFKKIWDEAEKRIRSAERIIWIGYSLPASDASAVESILTALSENTCDDLEVEIVMGPPSHDTERVKALLDRAIGAKVDPELHGKLNKARDRLEQRREKLRTQQQKREREGGMKRRALGASYDVESLFEAPEFSAMAALAGFQSSNVSFNEQVKVLSVYAQDYLRTHAIRHRRGLEEQQLAEELEGVENEIKEVGLKLRELRNRE